MQKRQFETLVIACFVMVAVSFAGGYRMGVVSRPNENSYISSLLIWAAARTGKSPLQSPNLRPIQTLWEVLDKVKNHFVSPDIDSAKLTDGAIRGMLKALDDKYTRYMNPSEYSEFLLDNAGEFDGIGAHIGLPKPTEEDPHPRLTIFRPLDGSPAVKAGLKAMDRVLKIDGKSTEDMTLEQAVRLIRGPRGTRVTLTIERDGEKEPLDIVVVRDRVEIAAVQFEMREDKIGHIQVAQFNERTEKDLDHALTELTKQKARGFVLDLRDDPGGLLDVAVAIASKFIEKGIVVVTRGRDGKDEKLETVPGKYLDLDIPFVVLVNQGSASASEILAGALQDYGLAKIVGAHTYGKASVQVVVKLSNGGALAITTAKYFTPKMRDITEHGIRPDVTVDAPEAAAAVSPKLPAREGAETGANGNAQPSQVDWQKVREKQLRRAVQVLEKDIQEREQARRAAAR